MARKPAQIVKCPHCSWTGSARGLFTHSRLAHPSLPTPKTKGRPVYATSNPNAIGSVTKPLKSNVSDDPLSYFNQRGWKAYKEKEPGWAYAVEIVSQVVVEMARRFNERNKKVVALGSIPEVEGEKLITPGVVKKGVRKRTK